MKRFSVVSVTLLLAAFSAYGQGATFLYDQESSTNSGYYGYGGGPLFIEMVPNTGQSFTLPNDPQRYGPWAGKLLTGDDILGLQNS